MKKIILFIFLGALCFWGYAQTSWEITGNSRTTSANFLGTTGCNPLIFKTNSTERMRLAGTGTYLGIGTTTPRATLHLHGAFPSEPSCGIIILDKDEDPTGTRSGAKLLQLSTFIANIGFSAAYNNQDITFLQHEQGRFFIEGPGGGLVISPNGNVGIGKISPQAKLDVNGTISASALSASGLNISNSVTTKDLHVTGGANVSNYLTTKDLYVTGQGKFYGFLEVQKMRIEQTLCVNEIKVMNPSCWPDYVFAKDYNLLPLSEVEQFITENQHLPGVPSAAEVEANGVNLGKMNNILLEKVEELTLYIIQLEKRLSEVEKKKGGK